MIVPRTAALGAAALSIGFMSSAADANGRGGSLKDGPVVEYARPFSWTGFYVGLHVGYGWNDQDWQFVPGATSTDQDGDGFFGGGQIGYNWQTGSIVFGIEADAAWAAIEGDKICPNPAFSCQHDVNWMASIRGRLGTTAFNPMTLLYATAGWGWADINYDTISAGVDGAFSKTHSGFVVGGGVEHAVSVNTTIKFEYLAYLLDDVTAPPGTLSGAFAADLEPTLHTVKLGVNFKF